jgi:putative endonuclease
MKRGGYVYIMTNKHRTVLYVCVISDLVKRIQEHKNRVHPRSFTARYNIDRLVYYQGFHRIEEAIAREKQIKAGSRKSKEGLILGLNPKWKDLFSEIVEQL